jgi:dihydrofolate reductase
MVLLTLEDMMGKLTLWMQSSLDGYTAGPNGEFDWPVVKKDLTEYFLRRLDGSAMFLYGRKVYDGMAAYWPTAGEDPSSDSFHVAFSKLWKATPKAVLSRSLTAAEWDTTVLAGIEQVRELKSRTAGDVVFFGGSDVAGQLIAADLIDEFQIFVHPVVLGGGAPLFPGLTDRRRVSLVDVQSFGHVVSLRHACAH